MNTTTEDPNAQTEANDCEIGTRTEAYGKAALEPRRTTHHWADDYECQQKPRVDAEYLGHGDPQRCCQTSLSSRQSVQWGLKVLVMVLSMDKGVHTREVVLNHPSPPAVARNACWSPLRAPRNILFEVDLFRHVADAATADAPLTPSSWFRWLLVSINSEGCLRRHPNSRRSWGAGASSPASVISRGGN